MLAVDQLSAVTTQCQKSARNLSSEHKQSKKTNSYQEYSQFVNAELKKSTITSIEVKEVLEYEKFPELTVKIIEEGRKRDSWSAEIAELNLTKLAEQLALNSYIEKIDKLQILLHLRPAQRYLNKSTAHEALQNALSQRYGYQLTLKIIEDNDAKIKTPVEWRQMIYKEKLEQARESVIADKTIQKLRLMFDAQLYEESIRPI